MAMRIITGSDVPLGTSVSEIREDLAKIGVNGIDIDCRWDIRSGACIVKFKRNGVEYTRRSTMQPNASKNMRVICLNLKQKVRDHLRGVEPFEDSMYKYAALPPGKDAPQETPPTRSSAYKPSPETLPAYDVLGVDAYATDDLCEKAYMRQVKAWHPDRFHGDQDMQQHAEKKTQQINDAWARIKKDRGIE